MYRIARTALICIAFVTCLSVFAQNTQQRPFVSGGRVKLKLESGAYKIQPSADNSLRITWSGDSVERPIVEVSIQTSGNAAEIKVHSTPHNNFHATIEIPAKTDLHVRLTAGDLNVSRISGSKDIESRAGDIEIDIGEASDYAHVDASVMAGDLSAAPFKVSKGGLFRSFKWNGPGAYSLHAHLLAGDLTLRGNKLTNN